jgi:hypothetical protein
MLDTRSAHLDRAEVGLQHQIGHHVIPQTLQRRMPRIGRELREEFSGIRHRELTLLRGSNGLSPSHKFCRIHRPLIRLLRTSNQNFYK